jgi:N-acetylglucosaminyldiphosphoundecaprenol N-acetyl-beta-D-mannosaminyltransferase
MYEFFGVSLSRCSMEQIVERVSKHIVPAGEGPQMIFTINLDHVVKLRKNERFRRAYRHAAVVTADGAPICLYARLRRAPLARITGADLFVRVMGSLAPAEHRCFFVVSDAALGQAVVERLMKRGFRQDQLGFCAPPARFEQNRPASAVLGEQIAAFGPTHLFFCLGAPKSEIWCHEHAAQIGDAYVLCAGAAAEFYLGTKRRAPMVMQKSGLEWLWRWAQEPRRLSRRYFIESWGFFNAVWEDLRTENGSARRR